jgi:putative FmdB family regulatory protein
MPFYEYQCRACQAQVEVLQKISDPPLRKCPECGRSQMTKLVSAPVFRLKGAGWYETDFKSDKDNKRNLVEAEKEPAKPEKADTPEKPEKVEKTEKAEKTEKTEKAESKSAAESKPAPKSTARTTRNRRAPVKRAAKRAKR